MRNTWNDRYSNKEYIYGKQPNLFFKQQLDRLKPGVLLLPCEGEGRNAVYAAKKGWTVAAFDFSDEAQQKAYALAEEENVRINYAVLSAENFGCGAPGFETIALIYAHFAPELRYQFHKKTFNCLLPGGVVLLEAFSKNQINNLTGGPKDINMLYSVEEIENDFSDYNILYLEELEIELYEGILHEGKASVIRMIAQKATY